MAKKHKHKILKAPTFNTFMQIYTTFTKSRRTFSSNCSHILAYTFTTLSNKFYFVSNSKIKAEYFNLKVHRTGCIQDLRHMVQVHDKVTTQVILAQ